MQSLKYLVISVLFVGCASTVSISVDDVANKAGMHLGDEFSLVYIPSSGTIADATFISLSKTKGPSESAITLAKMMENAQNKTVKIAVGGPNSAMTSVVIIDASELNDGKVLTGLELVFVGDASDSEKVEHEILTLSGKYYFEPAG